MAQNMGLNGGIARHGFLRLFLKEELLRLYCKCGEALHQGNIEKLIAPWRRKVTDFPAINAIAQKIKDLLNFHLIVGCEADRQIFCVLSSSESGHVTPRY